MPAKTPKREWSKRPKPKAPTLSLGSSGGACRRLHPSTRPQMGGGSDADGNVTVWPRHEQLPVKDHSVDEDHFEALDEAEIADIVTRAREFLEERGASQEEELFEVLGPRQAQRVQVSFGSLVACLTRQPGFHVIYEGECSRVYYQDPKQYDATRTASAQSSLAPTPASLVPGSGLLDASSEGSLIEARAVAAVGSGRASPSGSSGSGSYASAMDKQEEERRNACTQTTFDEETPSRWQPWSTRVTCGTQTSAWDSAEEEKEVVNGLRSEEQEQQGILSSSSLSGEATVAGACLRNTGVEEGSCQEDSLSVATNEESLLVRAIGSSHEPVALPAKLQGEVLSGAVECHRVPEFAGLQWKLEQSKGRTSPVQKSSQGGPTGSMPKSKSEAQLISIVKSIKKKMPHCCEAEIRCHLDQVRCIQGGFSQMTLRDIRALVLSHMENKNGGSGDP